jgi:hypothetical protein
MRAALRPKAVSIQTFDFSHTFTAKNYCCVIETFLWNLQLMAKVYSHSGTT